LAELAYAADLKSVVERHEGSSPSGATMTNVHVDDDGKVFMNALLPAPNNLKSYMILRNKLGNVVGMMIDPEISADTVELLLGVDVETVFVEQSDPITDVVSRMAGL
jgi:hypothetical protein